MDLTDRGVIYPGHPLVVATIIMELYPSFEEANRPTEHGWSEVLSDHRVPGAGDHVGAAMRTLSIGAKGGSPDEMIHHATTYWNDGRAGGHINNIDDGKEQARAFEDRFRELAENFPAHGPTG